MCGIVGAAAQREVAPVLLEGLARLEYRGYDSAGICTIDGSSKFCCLKTISKVDDLRSQASASGCPGTTGIAHTRWATHGRPCLENAHPHIHENLALVHNGIIENYAALKAELTAAGYTFLSDTDTEVLLCLIHSIYTREKNLLTALRLALHRVEGSYAIALADLKNPHVIYGARQGSPLVVGLGIGENFLASDAIALLPVTHRFIYLDEGEITEVSTSQVTFWDLDGNRLEKTPVDSDLDAESVSKGPYRHFMQKEICQQPEAVIQTAMGRVSASGLSPQFLASLHGAKLSEVQAIKIVACGTSYHAGLVGKYWLESLTGLPTSAEIASEYRYHKAVVRPGTLFIAISQSGETADTLACLRLAKTQNYLSTLAVCNVNGSSLVRESDCTLFTRAGVEIGVASTKAFTTQLLCLLMLAVALGVTRGSMTEPQAGEICDAIGKLPDLLRRALTHEPEIESLAASFAGKHHTLFLGRGIMYPIALEGALKLKEISYIHAEGYAAGELKHGPIALIDENMPVVVVAPDNALLGKLISNLEEVRARGGKLVVFVAEGVRLPESAGKLVAMPACSELTAPILYTVPLQLLAYHCALINGTDVDQPRNLAKSVTVE